MGTIIKAIHIDQLRAEVDLEGAARWITEHTGEEVRL